MFRHAVYCGQPSQDLFFASRQQIVWIANTLFFQMPHNLKHTIDKGSAAIDLIIDRRRHICRQARLVAGLPEIENRLHQIDDAVAAFHMTLLSEVMNQNIPAPGYFVDTRGNIPQPTLGADIVEINREQP